MSRKFTVIPEQCSGCRICELACSIKNFGANNPKKSAIRVIITYPQPVLRMPVVCSQCKEPPCEDVCPVDAIYRQKGVVVLNKEVCISCFKCAEACPFGAIYAHDESDYPIKCDMCGDESPHCIEKCPKNAIRLIPETALGESKRLNNVLSYSQMKEIEYYEKDEKKVIHYAEIGKEEI